MASGKPWKYGLTFSRTLKFWKIRIVLVGLRESFGK